MKARLTKLFTLLTILTLGITNVWAVDYSSLNYNGETSIPSGYKCYGSSAGATCTPAAPSSMTVGEGGAAVVCFDVTDNGSGGGSGAYNKRAKEFVIYENCSVEVELYTGNAGRVFYLYNNSSTAVASKELTSKNTKYVFNYDFTGATAVAPKTYSFSGSGSKVYISKITFTPAVACTETAPTSVAVSGGATYDKGDALSNLSAAVLGGSGTMSYQWYRNTTNAATVSNDLKLANCTTATLAPSNKVGTYYYYCVASNCAGSVTSNTTAVTINANCSATGDIFTLTMNSENAPTSEVKTPASSTMSIDKYINIDGGDIILVTGSSQHSSITTTPRIKLGGSSGYAQITLDCPLQEGDKITFEKTNKIALAADASGTNKIQLASGTNEYTITKEDCLYNQSILYVLRDGNNVEISSITITRPAPKASHTLSYVVDPVGKATVTLSTTSVKEEETATATYSAIDAEYEFDEWQISGTDASIDDAKANPVTITMGTSDATITLKLKLATTKYAITKGSHANGDFTISPAEQEENGIVTLVATPSTDYMFDAWEIVKTSDASATGITVDANGQFTMPAYPVTVNATFVADTRSKILYVTATAEATVKANDKLYAALKDIYNVSIVGFNSDADQTNYDLVVLHESVGGGNYGATAVAAAKTGSTPVLNTKSYFYNDGRWNWGTPNAGKSVKGCTPNAAYCNIANHPIFAGVIDGGFVEITDAAAEKCMQPIGAFTAGKEGYTLATTPNADSGDGCAIHELTPAQRGAASGKYLMISVSNAKLDALNANGQKLFQNAAAYLIDGSASWTPVAVPTNPEVEATPSENYTEGNAITLTASAEGTSASTTYTWYKGADWATASATTPVQAASTSGATFTKTAALEDAGTYWCNISNGTSCDVQASVTITVSSASTPTHAISYDNVKGADMSAYPTEYTEGVGVASFDPLADITGWHFVEWSPASIATTETTDQTITAVWAQVFEVTFNLQGHGEAIAKQDVIDGDKANKPADPSAIGWDFGGWFTDAACTAGNEFDFNTAITETKELFAKWTEFDGCALLVPATSGSAPAVDDVITMQTGSKGGEMKVVGTPLSYSTYGLGFDSNSSAKASVTLNNALQAGSVISLTLVANGTSARGLHLYTGNGSSKITSLGWGSTIEKYTEATFTYTVVADDGLDGTNEFQLWRNNSVYLKSISVTNCGAAVVYHDLTSAVDPAGKGTVTLGASSVREGLTTTAEYSAIDEAYEFDTWEISGAGASIADASANPATITMGTEDAVVTLKLKVKAVKYTVTYYDDATELGTEEVTEGEHPTATGIVTKKQGFNFLGWSETNGGAVVDLNGITISAAKNLYAKYEAIDCSGTGTKFKFQLKTDLTNGAVFTSAPGEVDLTTANYLSALVGGDVKVSLASGKNTTRVSFYDNKALGFANGDGATISITLTCPLATGDVVRYINYASSGNRMTLSDGTNTMNINGNGAETIQEIEVPAAWDGAYDLTLVRGGNTPKLTYFEIYRRPVLTAVALNDFTMRKGNKRTPELILTPEDGVVESQVWSITASTPADIATIDAATGEITATEAGEITVQVKLNDNDALVATCTVTIVDAIAQADVTKSTIWDWKNTGATANIQLSNSTDPKKNEGFVMANAAVNNDANFESDKLYIEGEYVVRDYDKTNPYFQGQNIKFNTTVAGLIRVTFSNTGGNPARELYINNVGTGLTSASGTLIASDLIEVPAGEVSVTAYLADKSEDAAQKYIRISKIEFYALGHSRSVTAGNLGTLCLPNNFIARGVDVYELAGKEATYGKIVFADLEPDELLVAGQAYIFQANDATAKFYYAPGDPVDAPLTNSALRGNLGATITFQPNSAEAENVYFVKDHALWSAKETGVTIGQYRAYLQMDAVSELANPNPAPGRRYIMLGTNGQNQAQGIDDVQDDVRSTKMLIDGRLFILRGEKIYDATGRLVK